LRPRIVPESLLRASDEQLYLSKQRGRNCVSLQFAGEPGEPGGPSLRTAVS
jgi:hypothetical protein